MHTERDGFKVALVGKKETAAEAETTTTATGKRAHCATVRESEIGDGGQEREWGLEGGERNQNPPSNNKFLMQHNPFKEMLSVHTHSYMGMDWDTRISDPLNTL